MIERALNAGYEPESLLLEDSQIEGEAKDILRRCADIPVFTASLEVLRKLTGFSLTRGALCAMKRRELQKAEDLCKTASRIVILEDVENPANVGAIFRSAAALGMEAVLLTGDCSDPLYRRAARVSMGTVFRIPWTYLRPGDGGLSYIDTLHGMGFKAAAMALRGSAVSIDDPGLMRERKTALIFGNEGNGLREETIEKSDYIVKIPMAPDVDSLNVAAASAVAFWQLRPHWI